MKRLSKMIVVVLIVTMMMPWGAFATTAELSHDTTTPGQSLAGKYPDQKVDFKVSLTDDKEVELTIPTNIPKDELAKAVAEGKLDYSMDRDESRHYVDPEKFHNPYMGGPLKDWTDNRDEGAAPIFEVKDVTVEGAEIPEAEAKTDEKKEEAVSAEDEESHSKEAEAVKEDEKIAEGEKAEATAPEEKAEAAEEPKAEAPKAEESKAEEPAKEKQENGVLKLKFDSKCYFYDIDGNPDYSVPHTVGGAFIDLCGYFNFNVNLDGKVIGSQQSKIVPYEKYRTAYELFDELETIKNHEYKNNVYAEVQSYGHTTAFNYDQQYVIIAKDKKAVERWLEYTEESERNPEQVLKDIEAGKYDDLKVPMFIGNAHANETSAISGIMEFIQLMVNGDNNIPFNEITSYTQEGKDRLKYEKEEVFHRGLSKQVESYTTEIGRLRTEAGIRDHDEYGDPGTIGVSTHIDLEKYYNVNTKTVNRDALLDDVFFVLVPTMNPEGHETMNRCTADQQDPNRDEANQTLNETANYMALIGKYNPMVYDETHGRVEGMLVEPCTPPHEPNFEYDLIAKQFMQMAEALGNACISNNDKYNSFELPARDYIAIDENSPTGMQWAEPWDDMTTAYGSQFPVLIGTCGLTWEVPAYNSTVAERIIPFGILGQAQYVQKSKAQMLKNQATLFKRGVNNENSNDKVAPYYVDQYDQPGVQADLMRPVHDGKGENHNFYAECFIIPLDKQHQRNIEDAAADMKYLVRNDVKVNRATSDFEYKGVKYPKGTMVVSMYQAKRSLAHSQLFSGSFVTVWKGLFSESLAQRPYARGYDIVTVAEPKEYKEIIAKCGDEMKYEEALGELKSFGAQSDGIDQADVIVRNTSNDSAAAMNKLIKEGKQVGFITEGKYRGNFIISRADFDSLSKDYTLIGEGVYGAGIKAKVIEKSPLVYITAYPQPNKHGYIGFSGWRYPYGYDNYALKKMGFESTGDMEKADVLMGQGKDTSEEFKALIDAGKPVLAHGPLAELVGGYYGFPVASCDYGTDTLNFVEYPEESLINQSYITEGDFINYQYGTGYFPTVPEGAKVLVKNAGKTPLQGCVGTFDDETKNQFDTYNSSPVALEYKQDGKDIVAFANLLTHKRHQTDEYTFISNFLFERGLGDKDYEGVAAPTEPEEFEYTIVEGANPVWNKGDDGNLKLVVKRSVDDEKTFENFEGIDIDGQMISKDDYTAEAGSVVVNLKSSYLSTLESGKHILRVVFKDGSAVTAMHVIDKNDEGGTVTNPDDNNKPSAGGNTSDKTTVETVSKASNAKTGDNTSVAVWALIMMVAAGAAVVIYNKKRA